jgi:hypothetical protein
MFYANIGMYTSTSAALYGGTTTNQVTGWSVVVESDTNAIELGVDDDVDLKSDNKRFIILGSQFFEGRGGRTQRWHGIRRNTARLDHAKAYSYYRNTSNDESGEMFTFLTNTVTATVDIGQFCHRGIGVTSGQGGADIDGSTPGVGDHTMVILELHDDCEVIQTTTTSNQNIATTGPVDLNISTTDAINIQDTASFTRATDIAINCESAMDVLMGVNVSAASQSVGSGQRFTGFAELTKNGTEESDSFAGDYLRGNQGSADTFGWSANLLGFVAVAANDDIGVSATELSGSEGHAGAVHVQDDWLGFWAINLDTMEPPASGSRNRCVLT